MDRLRIIAARAWDVASLRWPDALGMAVLWAALTFLWGLAWWLSLLAIAAPGVAFYAFIAWLELRNEAFEQQTPPDEEP